MIKLQVKTQDEHLCVLCGGLLCDAQVVADDVTRRAHLTCWVDAGRKVIAHPMVYDHIKNEFGMPDDD